MKEAERDDLVRIVDVSDDVRLRLLLYPERVRVIGVVVPRLSQAIEAREASEASSPLAAEASERATASDASAD
jgi:hypothetical protein